MDLKYKVKEILDNYPYDLYHTKRNELLNELKISNGRLSQLLNLKADEQGDWKADQLKKVAQVLQTDVNSLYPTTFKKARKRA